MLLPDIKETREATDYLQSMLTEGFCTEELFLSVEVATTIMELYINNFKE